MFPEKRVLVTGGSRGLGWEIVQAFKEQGAEVHYIDHNTDVRNPYNFQNFSYDIVVNNAGSFSDAITHNMDDESWNSVIETNLLGTFNVTRAALPYMREVGWGRIINISSVQGQTGVVGASNYAAAKAGIIGFTKSVAKENARKGITVNAVALGFIDTGMFLRLSKELQDSIIQQIPMKRAGRPDEVTSVILFLASYSASYITGQTININGGYYV